MGTHKLRRQLRSAVHASQRSRKRSVRTCCQICRPSQIEHTLHTRTAYCLYTGCCGYCCGCHLCYLRRFGGGVAMMLMGTLGSVLAVVCLGMWGPYNALWNCPVGATDVDKTCWDVYGAEGSASLGYIATVLLTAAMLGVVWGVNAWFASAAAGIVEAVNHDVLMRELGDKMGEQMAGLFTSNKLRSTACTSMLCCLFGVCGAHAFHAHRRRTGALLAVSQIAGTVLLGVGAHFSETLTGTVTLLIGAVLLGAGVAASLTVCLLLEGETGAENTATVRRTLGPHAVNRDVLHVAHLHGASFGPVMLSTHEHLYAPPLMQQQQQQQQQQQHTATHTDD